MANLFHACKNEKDILVNYAGYVLFWVGFLFFTYKTGTPGEGTVAKLSFKCVWVSTLLNGLDSSLCMPDRLYMKLSQEPWGQEKYSSISRPIGQWSLTHAFFNITVINKEANTKILAACHCLLEWHFWPKVLLHPPKPTHSLSALM